MYTFTRFCLRVLSCFLEMMISSKGTVFPVFVRFCFSCVCAYCSHKTVGRQKKNGIVPAKRPEEQKNMCANVSRGSVTLVCESGHKKKKKRKRFFSSALFSLFEKYISKVVITFFFRMFQSTNHAIYLFHNSWCTFMRFTHILAQK